MKNPKESKKFKLEITEEGLNTIIHALECYSRLGIRQFKYCLEHLPDFAKLDYDVKSHVENYLQSLTGGEKNLGIYHSEVKPFTEAYQIKKEIEKRVNLARTDGIRDTFSNVFDGALYKKDYLPKFLNDNNEEIKDCKEFPIPAKIRPKLKIFVKNKNWEKMWELINNSINFKNVRGNKSEVSEDLSKVTVWKPYLLNTPGERPGAKTKKKTNAN